jgi:hypothetical protein
MTYKQALLYNCLSACCCYIGLIIGIVVGDSFEANQWIYAVAGGMFLYISLCDMMPELTEIGEELEKSHFRAKEKNGESNDADNIDRQRSFFKLKILFLQNLGIISGFSIMLVMAIYSKRIHF